MGVRVIRFARISPQCKGGAVLIELYSDLSKYTFRYTYHVTTCLPSMILAF